MVDQANTVYNPTDPRAQRGDPRTGPQGQSYYYPVDAGEQERIIQAQVMADDLTDPDVIRALRPIALPQVALMPPRFGYGHPVIDVEDCVDADRSSAERYDFSGSQGGYSGNSYPSLGVW